MFFAFLLWISFHGIAFGISVNVDPVKPALGNSMTVTCKRSSSSTSSISWSVDSTILTTCDGTADNFCIPSPPGHTFSTDVSANEFNLALATTVITDCKTYTCTDIGNSETVSKNIQLADYSKNDFTPTEPGANTNGSISITTGCVFSPDDLTITWTKIVDGNSAALSDPSPVTSTERSTCTRACHTEEDKKVTSGFTHTEYTGTDSETFQYMVTVSHSSYPDNADIYTWTSANYTQKKATTGGNTGGLSTGAKAGIIATAVFVVVVTGATIAVVKLKKKGKLPCKGDKEDTSRDVESTRSSPEKAENKLLNKEKQSSATGKGDGGNKGKHVSDTQIHLDKSQKVHPENEEKLFRPQPLPPPGAKLNHSLAEDKHGTGAQDFSRTKLPPILQNT